MNTATNKRIEPQGCADKSIEGPFEELARCAMNFASSMALGSTERDKRKRARAVEMLQRAAVRYASSGGASS